MHQGKIGKLKISPESWTNTHPKLILSRRLDRNAEGAPTLTVWPSTGACLAWNGESEGRRGARWVGGGGRGDDWVREWYDRTEGVTSPNDCKWSVEWASWSTERLVSPVVVCFYSSLLPIAAAMSVIMKALLVRCIYDLHWNFKRSKNLKF